jgi:hypothetical protein
MDALARLLDPSGDAAIALLEYREDRDGFLRAHAKAFEDTIGDLSLRLIEGDPIAALGVALVKKRLAIVTGPKDHALSVYWLLGDLPLPDDAKAAVAALTASRGARADAAPAVGAILAAPLLRAADVTLMRLPVPGAEAWDFWITAPSEIARYLSLRAESVDLDLHPTGSSDVPDGYLATELMPRDPGKPAPAENTSLAPPPRSEESPDTEEIPRVRPARRRFGRLKAMLTRTKSPSKDPPHS